VAPGSVPVRQVPAMNRRWRGVAAGIAGYAALFRLGASWGATPSERRRPLPGDELAPGATLLTTHGITVDAPPEAVWPWLVQMGWGRGGWYTYRWVDRLLFPANGPSADQIVPALQHLQVGDRVLDGPPDADCWFTVEVLERPRAMVLRSTTHVPIAWRERFAARLEWVWSWHLDEVSPGVTRLVQRNRMMLRPRWFEAAFLATIVPADFIMARSHLRAIRRLAETAPAVAGGGAVRRSTAPASASRPGSAAAAGGASIDLYWLPLGAGGWFVRLNGRIYEAIKALLERRRPLDLYHTALEVRVPEGRFIIENSWPITADGASRGVVVEGPVATRWIARSRVFRYEVRRWRDGVIADAADAVASPQPVSDDPLRARLLLDLVGALPTPAWGRDELGTGDMWNSNSVISWLLTRSGVQVDAIGPPAGGRAPGWEAGIAVAHRQHQGAATGGVPRRVRVRSGG
jgi:hypothetical protein